MSRGKSTLSDYWNGVADLWQRRGGQVLWRSHCDGVHAGLLKRWLPPEPVRHALKTDLFDEAFGGGLWPVLSAAARRVTGIDVSANVCRAAARNHPGIEAIVADVRDLPFEDDCFDLVVSTSTLDHFQSQREIPDALGEIARVLRPGGRLILTMDNPANPVVWLRNALPIGSLNRIGAVPYAVGRTAGRKRLAAYLRRAGLEARQFAPILHCPRAPAVLLAAGIRRAGPSLQRRLLRFLEAMERLESLPTRWLTGYFVAVQAVKPPAASGSGAPP